MRDQIRLALSMNFNGQADALLLRDIQDGLIAANNFDLPNDFLKRWLITQSEKNTVESINFGFDAFAQNLRWTLVRSKIARSSNVQISDEDLKEFYRIRIRGYLGGMAGNDELIESIVTRAMEDEKQMSELYEEVMAAKTFEAMKSRVAIVDKPIDEEAFNSIMAAAQYEAAKARGEVREDGEALTLGEEIPVEEVEAEEVA